MIYRRLYADESGESHWETVEVSLAEKTFAPPAKAIEISEPETAARLLFLRLKSGWNEPVHPTPVAQKLICLAGRARVTASDGEVQEIGPGDVWHMEDLHGKGHHTEVVELMGRDRDRSVSLSAYFACALSHAGRPEMRRR